VNAVPWPAGWAVKRPASKPLREPTTETLLISEGATAGKSMFVPGAASGVPGKGSTSSAADETVRRGALECAATATADAAPPTAATLPSATIHPAVEPA
jgi:hypothetical protein